MKEGKEKQLSKLNLHYANPKADLSPFVEYEFKSISLIPSELPIRTDKVYTIGDGLRDNHAVVGVAVVVK